MTTLSLREALSGVSGSVSLAAWLFVLIPQLVENYRSGSAEAISLTFLGVWFVGDLANFFGSVWAGLVPTVTALAVYFCVADTVLITQCLYYHYILNHMPHPVQLTPEQVDDPNQPLLDPATNDLGLASSRRCSSVLGKRPQSSSSGSTIMVAPGDKQSIHTLAINALAVFTVVAIGTGGWLVAWKTGLWKPTLETNELKGNGGALGAETLGYVSAILYLGARIPQIAKNFRERSCEGLSLLFFILSLVGNLTYGGGILFHSLSKPYLLKNTPWLIGSLGTMAEDVLIFIQFHMYKDGH